MADGVGAMSRGDYYKGVEKMVPEGLENAMKAFRMQNEGYSLKNGDVMIKPEDMSGMYLMMDAVGIPSSIMKNHDWIRSQQYVIGEFYQKRSKQIEHEYVSAVRSGDTDKTSELREDWMNLQAGKDHLRQYFGDSPDALKKQPLSTLLKYPHTQAMRERKLQASVP